MQSTIFYAYARRFSMKDTEEQKQNTTPAPNRSDKLNPPVKEYGGPKGPEPTRYGDWERKGRCVDF